MSSPGQLVHRVLHLSVHFNSLQDFLVCAADVLPGPMQISCFHNQIGMVGHDIRWNIAFRFFSHVWCMYMHVCMHVHICVCVWRSEAGIESLSHRLSTLFIETRSFR